MVKPSQASAAADVQLSFEQTVIQLVPPAEFDTALREAMSAVESTVRQVFGEEACVKPFGSIVQGAHLKGSDLDLCMDVPDNDAQEETENGKPDNKKQVAALRRLMRKLPKEFHVIETRFFKHIKVPILILGYTGAEGEEVETDVSVGVVFEGVEKGFTDRLVRRILARAPRALHTVRLVKLWAKIESLNKAYDGFLNALGWTLLVLYFFISRGEATTEMLYDEEENENGCNGDGSVPPPLDVSPDGNENPEEADLTDIPSGEDLADFFDMVADYETWPEQPETGVWSISLVDGEMVEVARSEGKQYADQCDFFLEDPGVRMTTGKSENVARALRKGTWKKTLDKCREAAVALRESEDGALSWLDNLLQRVAATKASPAGAKAAAAKKRPWPGQQAEIQPWPASSKRQRKDGAQQSQAWGAGWPGQNAWPGQTPWQQPWFPFQPGAAVPSARGQKQGKAGQSWAWKR